MPDAEIKAVRKLLEANPRPAELSQRRKRLDALGGQYGLPADVRVEPINADGVAAEWADTSTSGNCFIRKSQPDAAR